MRTELLTTFLEVSRTLHVRHAADNLFLTQAAVSARIKALEQELGVQLFDRSNKRLQLTAEGNKLVKYANELLTMWQKTKQDVGVTEAASSQLFVGAMTSIWDMVLHDWLQKIHRNLEDVHLYTQNYSPLELRKQLLSRLVDIGFIFDPPYIEEIRSVKVATIPLQLVSDRQLTSIDEIDSFVMVDYGESVNNKLLADVGEQISVRHHMSQPKMAMNFIIEAGGAAFLPRQMTFPAVRKGQLNLVPNTPNYNRDVYAIYLSKGHKVDIIEDALQLFPYSRP